MRNGDERRVGMGGSPGGVGGDLIRGAGAPLWADWAVVVEGGGGGGAGIWDRSCFRGRTGGTGGSPGPGSAGFDESPRPPPARVSRPGGTAGTGMAGMGTAFCSARGVPGRACWASRAATAARTAAGQACKNMHSYANICNLLAKNMQTNAHYTLKNGKNVHLVMCQRCADYMQIYVNPAYICKCVYIVSTASLGY